MTIENVFTNNDYFLNSYIVFLFSYISAVFLFASLKDTKWNNVKKLLVIIIGVVLPLSLAFVREMSLPLSQLLFYLSVGFVLTIIDRNIGLQSLVGVLLSVSFVHVIRAISLIIIGSVIWMTNCLMKNVFVDVIIGAFQLVLSIGFMKIKRIRNGFQFFCSDNYMGIGICLSGAIFMMSCVDGEKIQNVDVLFVVIILGILIVGFGLYLWIRRSITAHYRERLQLKSEEHYKEMLEERDKELEKLSQSNEYLAKIVHRDNHLMSAIDASVDAYFISEDENRKDELLRELQTLAKERGELIAKEQLDSKLLPTTGNHLIDGAINDLYIKAAAHGIDFNLTVSATVDGIIGKYISQTDLQTLLSDHIKDAIIAVESRGEAGGKILVNLSNQNDNYSIDIYDNGIEFDIDTMSKLGLERVTTHADTGGSGIGFMTTFETLRKAYASLIITEFENKTPFTKSVSFRFDGESVFIIHSYRSEELKKVINRNDIMIR